MPEPFTRTNATLRLTACLNADKRDLLLSRLEAWDGKGAAVVKVRNREAAAPVAALAKKLGHESRALTPNQGAAEKRKVAAWFETAENALLAVSEPLAIPPVRDDIRRVYVMNLPPSLEAALADIETAGRDGLEAEMEFFASNQDREARLAEIHRLYGQSKGLANKQERAIIDLNETVAWLEHDGCARVFMAKHLWNRLQPICHNCGWCLGKPPRFLP